MHSVAQFPKKIPTKTVTVSDFPALEAAVKARQQWMLDAAVRHAQGKAEFALAEIKAQAVSAQLQHEDMRAWDVIFKAAQESGLVPEDFKRASDCVLELKNAGNELSIGPRTDAPKEQSLPPGRMEARARVAQMIASGIVSGKLPVPDAMLDAVEQVYDVGMGFAPAPGDAHGSLELLRSLDDDEDPTIH